MTALPKIREIPSRPEVIIITGEGDPEGAELALKSGAWDYLQKPISPQKIILPLNRVIQYRESSEKARQGRTLFKRQNIIGDSPRLTTCLETMAQASGTDANILITGETGTGKESFAKAIHDNSRRAEEAFVIVDCAAMPETLIESALFGYEKGAFTGADSSKVGLIKQADGGTLFLDEVGELNEKLQKAFLRVLQEHRYRPLGSKAEVESDFRLISATNKDLSQMVESGLLREDLFYRLNTISITLPPLRERPEDIRLLAEHYMLKICNKYGLKAKGFSADFFDVLSTYTWPGNIRELVNMIEETISRAHEEQILYPQFLPEQIRIQYAKGSFDLKKEESAVESGSLDEPPPVQDATPTYQAFRETVLAEMEKKYFQDLIKSTKGNIQEACRISGLGRSRLYVLLKKYNISRHGWD